MEKLNVQQICSIKVYNNSICTDYIYKVKPKYLSFLFPKEGFYYRYCIGSPRLVTKEEIENQGYYTVKDNKVFHKPHIDMRMSNQSLKSKYFQTEKELNDFIETELKSVNWIS